MTPARRKGELFLLTWFNPSPLSTVPLSEVRPPNFAPPIFLGRIPKGRNVPIICSLCVIFNAQLKVGKIEIDINKGKIKIAEKSKIL